MNNTFSLFPLPLPQIFILLRIYFILSAVILLSFQALAQKSDTLKIDSSKIKKHSPKAAALMSATVPGLGQVYNKKYWKVPIIYAGVAVFGYFINDNWKEYQHFRSAYITRVDTISNTYDQYDISNPAFSGGAAYSDANLFALQEQYRKWFELSVIGATIIYVLNIVDASVDGHLFTFDVSDDLSMRILPEIRPSRMANRGYAGLILTLKL